MKLVLDTNIYIAALLNEGLCFDIVNFVFNAKNGQEVFISQVLLSELKHKLQSKGGIVEPGVVSWLISLIEQTTSAVLPKETISAIKRDMSDNRLLECAVSSGADLIITMDKDLLTLKSFRKVGIVHPKTYIHMLPGNFPA